MSHLVDPLIAVVSNVCYLLLGPNGEDSVNSMLQFPFQQVLFNCILETLFPNLVTTVVVSLGPFFNQVNQDTIRKLIQHLKAHHAVTFINVFADNSIVGGSFWSDTLHNIAASFRCDYRLAVKDRVYGFELMQEALRMANGVKEVMSLIEIPLAIMANAEVVHTLQCLQRPIRRLRLTPYPIINDIHATMARVLEQAFLLQDLQILILPFNALVDPMVDALREAGRLIELHIESPAVTNLGNVLQLSAATLPFPSLQTIKATTSISHFTPILSAFCVRDSHLLNLSVSIPQLQSSNELSDFLRVLKDRAPYLKSLTLHITCVNAAETDRWMDMVSLQHFHQLQVVEISHPRPLPISNSTLTRLLVAWPDAIRVSLNPYPQLPAWPESAMADLSGVDFHRNPNLEEFAARLKIPRPGSPIQPYAPDTLKKVVLPGVPNGLRGMVQNVFSGAEVLF